MTRELATLLSAGLTVDQSLQFLVDVAGNTAQRKLFASLLERVRGGDTLADALDEIVDPSRPLMSAWYVPARPEMRSRTCSRGLLIISSVMMRSASGLSPRWSIQSCC